MEIQNNRLLSIDSSDIKDGVLYLPESVVILGDWVIKDEPGLVTVVAPGLTTIENENFLECKALTHFEAPMLKTIGGYNFRFCNGLTRFEAPVLTSIGDGNFYQCNALMHFEAPLLATIESYNFDHCNALTHFKAPALNVINYSNFQFCNALIDFVAPVLTLIGYSNFEECNALARFEAPMLTEIRELNFRTCKALTNFIVPMLTTIDDDNFYKCEALTDFEAPMLTSIGHDNFAFCITLQHFKTPMLTAIGRDNFFACALTHFEVPELTIMETGNFEECDALTNVRLGKYNYTVKSADRVLTIIEKTKKRNEIRIHTGFILNSYNGGASYLSETVLVEKDGFFAHGETVKKAMEDLQFKIAVEKIKKEPIYEDTVITEQYYRTITGACEQGIKNWREENNITVESLTAKELLPILEKTNAYGMEQFKALITFESI